MDHIFHVLLVEAYWPLDIHLVISTVTRKKLLHKSFSATDYTVSEIDYVGRYHKSGEGAQSC